MSLTHAILGILQMQPMTGYDLKTQCFDDSIAHFWPADQAQIYRTLDKMTEEGWLDSRIEFQENRPNRKIYSLTETGQTELQRWLAIQQPLPVYRQPFLIQLFFAKDLPNEQIMKLIDEQIEAHQQRLAHYQAIPLPPLGDPASNRELTLSRLTLELGIQTEETTIEWLKMAKNTIVNLPEEITSDDK